MKSDWSLRSNINATPYRGDCLEKKELDYPTIIWDYSRWERGCSLKTGERRRLADPAQRETGKTACRPVSDFKLHGRRPCPAGMPAMAPWRRRVKPPVKPSQTESNHFSGLTGLTGNSGAVRQATESFHCLKTRLICPFVRRKEIPLRFLRRTVITSPLSTPSEMDVPAAVSRAILSLE